MTTTLETTKRPLAKQLAADCDLSDEARKLLTPEIKAPQFLALLAREGHWNDALKFAPYGLPRRDAIWWACLCLWQFYRPTPPAEVDACLQAVVRWLKEPTEANRRAAHAAGRAAKVTTPAGNLALAVFMSTGSISLPGRPEVPAELKQLPQLLASAITLAAQTSPRGVSAARQNDFVRMALEVFAGRWPLPQAAAK